MLLMVMMVMMNDDDDENDDDDVDDDAELLVTIPCRQDRLLQRKSFAPTARLSRI